MTEAPDFACTLSDEEFRERRAMARELLLPDALETRWVADGLQIDFAGSDTTRARVEEFVSLERECCGFLTFDLSGGTAGRTLVLTITGPAEARDILHILADAVASRD